MSRISAMWVEDLDGFNNLVGQVIDNYNPLGRGGRAASLGTHFADDHSRIDSNNGHSAAGNIKMNKHRWHLDQGDKERSWGEVDQRLQTILAGLWLQYPKGWVAFTVQNDGWIKEIVFVKDGSAYKIGRYGKYIWSKKQAELPDVAILAYHKSLAIFRVLRKVESLVIASGYVPMAASLDVCNFINDQIKEKTRFRHKGAARV